MQCRLMVSAQADFKAKAAAWGSRGEKITGTEGRADESVRGGEERKIGRKVVGFLKKTNQQWFPLNKTPEDVFTTTCLRWGGAKACAGVINKASSRSVCVCVFKGRTSSGGSPTMEICFEPRRQG